MTWKLFRKKEESVFSDKRLMAGITVTLFLVALLTASIAVKMMGREGTTSGTDALLQEEVQSEDILQIPSEDASEAERAQHFEKVKSVAQEVDIWVIKEGCKASPVVLKKKEGDRSLTIRNDTDTSRIIGFSSEYEFIIGAGETEEVTMNDFYQGAGLYSFGCDREDIFGMVFVPDESS